MNLKFLFILTILPLLLFSTTTHLTLYSEGSFVERTYNINETGVFTKNIEELKNVVIDDVSLSNKNCEIYLLGNFYVEKNISIKKSMDELLNESLNNEIEIYQENNLRKGILTWYDSNRIGVQENTSFSILQLSKIDEIKFNNLEVMKNETKKEYEMKIFGKSNSQNSEVKFSYPKNSLSWNVVYTINDQTLTQEANIKNNDDEEYLNTTLKLTMTKPYFVNSYSSRNYYPMVASLKMDDYAISEEVAPYEFETSISNTIWSYSLKGGIDIPKRSTQKITIFNEKIDINKSYVWDSSRYNSNVNIVYSFTNKRNEILPAGKVRVFETGILMGEDSIENLRKNQSVELFVAPAIQFNIIKNKIYDNPSPLISGYKHEIKNEIELVNYGSTEEIIELRDKIYEKENMQIKEYSVQPYYSQNGDIKWKISIKPGETKKINYVYTYTSKY